MRIGPNGFVQGLVSVSPLLFGAVTDVVHARLLNADVYLTSEDMVKAAWRVPGIRLESFQAYLTLFVFAIDPAQGTITIDLAPQVTAAVRTRNRFLKLLFPSEKLKEAGFRIQDGFLRGELTLNNNFWPCERGSGPGEHGRTRHFVTKKEVPDS